MQVKLEVGSSGYIIESNRIIINVTVIARQGEFYVLRMPTGGAIKLRRGRIFLKWEETEACTHAGQYRKAEVCNPQNSSSRPTGSDQF